MYLHLGQDVVVRTEEIIGIFDMDNATVSRASKRYLAMAEKAGRVVNITGELPKTFVVCGDKRGQGREDHRLYLPDLFRHPPQAHHLYRRHCQYPLTAPPPRKP